MDVGTLERLAVRVEELRGKLHAAVSAEPGRLNAGEVLRLSEELDALIVEFTCREKASRPS